MTSPRSGSGDDRSAVAPVNAHLLANEGGKWSNVLPCRRCLETVEIRFPSDGTDDRPGVPAGGHHNIHEKPCQPAVPIHVGMDETKEPVTKHGADDSCLLFSDGSGIDCVFMFIPTVFLCQCQLCFCVSFTRSK